MKKSILTSLLGFTLSIATPSVVMADNPHEFARKVLKQVSQNHHDNHHRHERHKNRHERKHDRQKAKAKPPKRHHDRKWTHNKKHHHDKHHNRIHNKKHHVKKYYDRHRDSGFSITFNSGGSSVSYGNGHYVYDNYDHRVYDHRPKKVYRGKRIYERQETQARRIQRGIEKGQLVRREIRKLRREQRHIQSTIASYKRDGRFNHYERKQVHKLLDIASDNINRKRHNHRTRYNNKHRSKHYDYVWH